MRSLKDIPYAISLPCALLCSYISITSIVSGSSPEMITYEHSLINEHSDDRIASYNHPVDTLRDQEPFVFWFKTGIYVSLSLFNISAVRARYRARNAITTTT